MGSRTVCNLTANNVVRKIIMENDKVLNLCKVARKVLCYVPRSYENDGLHGELTRAVYEVEKHFQPTCVEPENQK
jgi:methyl coenzyme M reductase subunit C